MRYYYLTYYDIGIGFKGDIKEAAYFDLSNSSGPKSDFGRIACTYKGAIITDELILKFKHWYSCLETNMNQTDFDRLILFLIKYQDRHCIEFQLSEAAPIQAMLNQA